MTRLSYDTAEVLLYDPVSANRMATRAALFAVGFRHVETATTLKAFEEFIRNRPPDLALCEVQGSDTELCEIIQSMRQGHLVQNPFVVIIATAWEKSAALVTRVVDSGADDLLLRPFSTAQLDKSHRDACPAPQGLRRDHGLCGSRSQTRPVAAIGRGIVRAAELASHESQGGPLA